MPRTESVRCTCLPTLIYSPTTTLTYTWTVVVDDLFQERTCILCVSEYNQHIFIGECDGAGLGRIDDNAVLLRGVGMQ